ncbi:VOC family protein [Bowmanella sp. Y26]|uniref:VOC family protein n=1 Tax=Bowmanella yangjiangensis TaxID=2811230 RepID=UPI001BDBF4A8|nr:VOC family protein [Bowmanella yangjiangensis]MBT1063174.1 VOC family protein [Bowmanella yangjiangensis]
MIDIHAMFPVMVTSDLASIQGFYQQVFGFEAVFFDPNFYLHLLHPTSGIQLGFMQPQLANQPSFLHPLMQPQGYVISLEVKDAAAAYEQALQMKLNIAMALKEEPWGQIHFMLTDPGGFKVDVVQHLTQGN